MKGKYNLEMSEIVPEIDVLISCSLWLRERRVLPFQFSVAVGQGIDTNKDKSRLKETLINSGMPASLIHFVPDGPDIIAVSQSEFWQIECKGAGRGKGSTQRNNFDRALSSTVSYFTDITPEMPSELDSLQKSKPFLGLAIPATKDYMALLKKRVRSPLRKQLNLWVLLHNIATGNIHAVAPDEKYPNKLPEVKASQEELENTHSHLPEKSQSSPTKLTPKERPSRRIYHRSSSNFPSGVRTNSGANLNREWNVRARHALYHKDGKWFNQLERFPGAYFDPDGYILFKTKEEYLNHSSINIGEKVNVYGGISSLPGYKRMR